MCLTTKVYLFWHRSGTLILVFVKITFFSVIHTKIRLKVPDGNDKV